MCCMSIGMGLVKGTVYIPYMVLIRILEGILTGILYSLTIIGVAEVLELGL